jgi:hypothetical protein
VNVTVTTGEYRSGSKYWLVRYRLPDGKLIRKFFADKQSAEDCAEPRRRESADAAMIPEALKFEAAECDGRLRTHNWTLRRATEYVLQHVIPFEGKPRICDAVAVYMQEQAARGLARDTLSEMRHRMKVFVAKFGDRRLHELRLEDYAQRMKELASEGYEPMGVRHFLTRVSGFITWAIPRGYCVGKHQHHNAQRDDHNRGRNVGHHTTDGWWLQTHAQSQDRQVQGGRRFGYREGEGQPQRLRVDGGEHQLIHHDHGHGQRHVQLRGG